MIIYAKYDIEADGGFVLRNKYTKEIVHDVKDVPDLDEWEEIEEPHDEPNPDCIEEQPVLKASPKRARRTRKT